MNSLHERLRKLEEKLNGLAAGKKSPFDPSIIVSPDAVRLWSKAAGEERFPSLNAAKKKYPTARELVVVDDAHAGYLIKFLNGEIPGHGKEKKS